LIFFGIILPWNKLHAQLKQRTEETTVIVNNIGDTITTKRSVSVSPVMKDTTTIAWNNVITTDLFVGLLGAIYDIDFHTSLTQRISIGFTTRYGGRTDEVLGFGTEVRFYKDNKAFSGFYIAPNTSINYTEDNRIANIGILFGWQYYMEDYENITYGFAFGTNRWFSDKYSPKTLPMLHFDVGFAW
jgi:putative salt-induced outer membrane protein YdiY